jgi:hypothetical protein
LNIEICKNSDRHKNRQYYTESQFKTDFAIEHKLPAAAVSNDVGHPTCSSVKDIGTGMHPVPKNSIKAGTRDLSFQKYLHR